MIDPEKEGEEVFITIRCLDLEDRPKDLPEIVDQVWEVSYLEERFSFLFTTVYGWTNAWEVARPGSTPETWAHWQDQEAALDRLMADLDNAGLLPESVYKWRNNLYLDALFGDKEDDSEENLEEEDREDLDEESSNIFSEISAVFRSESENIRSFVEDDKIPLQTVLVFLEAIKRKVGEVIVMFLAEDDDDGEVYYIDDEDG